MLTCLLCAFYHKMTTIRIADPVQLNDGLGRTTSQGDSRSCTGVDITRTRSSARSDVLEPDDNIYNIRSPPRLPERITSRSAVPEQADENPSLHRPGDFKEKQVCKSILKN